MNKVLLSNGKWAIPNTILDNLVHFYYEGQTQMHIRPLEMFLQWVTV